MSQKINMIKDSFQDLIDIILSNFGSTLTIEQIEISLKYCDQIIEVLYIEMKKMDNGEKISIFEQDLISLQNKFLRNAFKENNLNIDNFLRFTEILKTPFQLSEQGDRLQQTLSLYTSCALLESKNRKFF